MRHQWSVISIQWQRRLARLIALIAVLLITDPFPLRAAEPVADAKDLPRLKPLEPAQALAAFQIKKGFRVELAAAEPDVVDPVAMAFDENGRLFVAEMRDYPYRRQEKVGQIRLLEDTDGDGVYDKSTVFAKDLGWPATVICYDGGVFVGAVPDILWLKDHDGDGVADERKVVFTGFTPGSDPEIPGQTFNGFKWGPDNRIHGATARNGGVVRSAPSGKGEPLDLSGRDFSFDPRTLTMRPESGTGQFGLSFDNQGREFVCTNNRHIMTVMYEDRYTQRNPIFAMPPALVDIAVEGPAASIFRISPDEPWRILRTRWRGEGLVKGSAEGGRPSGNFTSAAGITIYTGNGMPAEFVGNAFVADPSNNVVHRKIVRENGVELVAARPPDEERAEFLASRDTWFRPVNFANGPDGALYVVDMYRENIEEPHTIPEGIRKFLDFDSGNDRGRIYRVVPENFQRPAPVHLQNATTAELVALLEHPNGWHRETAARMLYARQDKSAVSLLEKKLAESTSPLGRLRALCALDGQAALSVEHLLNALIDPDPTVRVNAVRLSENFFDQKSELAKKIWSLASDPSPLVRYQLAFTLGEMPPAGRAAALAEILRHDADSLWTRAALLSSLAQGRGEAFAAVVADPSLAGSRGGQEFLRKLTSLIGVANQPEEVARVFDFLTAATTPPAAILRGLGEGLRSAGSSLAAVDKQNHLATAFKRARQVASDAKAAELDRVQSIELLGLTSFKEAGAQVGALIDPGQPQAIQLAAIDSLAQFKESAVAAALLKPWDAFTPRLRSEALRALLARPERAQALLEAIKAGAVQASALNASQIQFLRKHKSKPVSEMAASVLGAPTASPRQEVLATFKAALTLQGDAARGRKIYLERCVSCHRAENQGFALGPDFAAVKANGKEKLLDSIIDPNREVDPRYLAYVLETKAGESLMGVITSETAASIAVRQPFGKEDTVLRGDLRRMQSVGQSLMPEGLEAGLTPAQMADLLEFIETLK